MALEGRKPRMNGVMTAQTKEQSILLYMKRYTNPDSRKRLIDDNGVDGYDARKIFPCNTCCSSPDSDLDLNRLPNTNPQPVELNYWLLIENTNPGLKISEIFADLPDTPYHYGRYQIYHLVNSSLYILEERKFEFLENSYDDSCLQIRRLDIQNQAAGWKICNPLQFHTIYDIYYLLSAVIGKYIYVYNPRNSGKSLNCYIYDTIAQTSFSIANLPNQIQITDAIYSEILIPLPGRGMLFLLDLGNDERTFYLHDPYLNRWNLCKNYQPLPPILNSHDSLCLHSHHSLRLHCVLNGKLYFLYEESKSKVYKICAYDCWKGELLYQAELPKLHKGSRVVEFDPWIKPFDPKYFFAVSDSKLCVLWDYEGVFCAEIFVPPGPNPSPELLGVRYFRLGRSVRLFHCLTIDASLGHMAKDSTSLGKRREKFRKMKKSRMKRMEESSSSGSKTRFNGDAPKLVWRKKVTESINTMSNLNLD